MSPLLTPGENQQLDLTRLYHVVVEQLHPARALFVAKINPHYIHGYVYNKSPYPLSPGCKLQGERALLFHEPRTATVKVISDNAELWAIEKATSGKD